MNEMKLFLLSIEEAEKLSEEQRKTKFNGGSYWWWLRSPGNYADFVASVSSNGYDVSYVGDNVGNDYCGVRPALHLTSAICDELPKTENGCLLFGKRPKSSEAIEWLLIKEKSGVSTLLSKEILALHCFNSAPEKGNDFAASDIAVYMNAELLDACFSEKEKKLIYPVEFKETIKEREEK